MRISDWSSDVCSSDLDRLLLRGLRALGGIGGPARDHALDEARHPVVRRGEEDRGGGQRETEQDELEALRRAPPIAIGPRRFGARGGALPDVELRDHAAGSLLVRARISARGPSATMRPPSMTMMRSIGRAHVCTPVTNA